MESIKMQTEEGRDKIISIEEFSYVVVVNYQNASGEIRPISIPRTVIDYVKKIISGIEVGELYHSKYIYNKYLTENRIPSKIKSDFLKVVEDTMKKNCVTEMNMKWTMEDLRKSDDIIMDFQELIGTRDKNALYWQLYGSIKYWADKEQIIHNRRGGVFRVI